jgi:hypothetical protein
MFYVVFVLLMYVLTNFFALPGFQICPAEILNGQSLQSISLHEVELLEDPIRMRKGLYALSEENKFGSLNYICSHIYS